MGILDSLGIGNKSVKLKPAREAVRQAQTLLETKGSAVLQNEKLNELRTLLANRVIALQVAHEPDSVKQEAINGAIADVKATESAVNFADSFKGAHIERFSTEYARTFDTVLKPLRDRAAAIAPGAEFSPPVERQLEENARLFNIAMRKAKTATEARQFYDDAVTEHERLKKIAQAIKPEAAEASGRDQVASAELFKQLQQNVLALEMANAPGAPDLSKRLYATLPLSGRGDHAGALTALRMLERGMSSAAENNRASAEQALSGPRAAAQEARARMGRLVGNAAQSKLALVKAVLPTIASKLDTLEMFFDGNLTAKSATSANAMLKEITDMLGEAETLTPEKDKQNRATIGKIKDSLAPKSFVIFKGNGADAEALFPKEYSVLVAKKDALADEVEGMGVNAASKTVQSLMTEAQALIAQASARRSLLDRCKARLPAFENAVKAMNTVVKDDATTQNDPKLKGKTASGRFIDATAQLKSGLNATPPDAAALESLVAELEALMITFDPTAAGYKKQILDAHTASKTQAADFAHDKQSAEPLCKEADDALKKAKTAVGGANPADSLGLKSVGSEMAASKKQVRAATGPEALKLALERLGNAIEGAKRLQEFPGGDAPHSRAKLGEIDTRWTEAVTGVRSGLAKIKGDVLAADNLAAEGKSEIGSLIDTALARFNGTAFTGIIRTMTTDPTNENAAERMKAREDGLRLVRQFREAMSSDPVITSLVVTRAFSIDPFTTAHQALNDLDLNLSRAV